MHILKPDLTIGISLKAYYIVHGKSEGQFII